MVVLRIRVNPETQEDEYNEEVREANREKLCKLLSEGWDELALNRDKELEEMEEQEKKKRISELYENHEFSRLYS